MTRKNRLLVATFLTLLLGMGLSVIAIGTLSRPQRTRLPDGSTLQFVGLSRSDGAPLVHGHLWQKLLYPITPTALRPHLGANLVQLPAPAWPGSVAVGIIREGPPIRDGVPGSPAVLCIDRHGCPIEWSVPEGGRSLPSGHLQLYRTRVFPVRDPYLAHRYFVRDAPGRWLPITTYSAGHPLSTPMPPPWSASPLSQTAENLGLRVTLMELRPPVPLPSPKDPILDEQTVTTEANFRIGGPAAARRWKPVEFSVTDASGNRHIYEDLQTAPPPGPAPKPSFSPRKVRGEWQIRIPGGLCAREAWKVRVEFSCHRDPGALPVAVWELPGVRIPPSETPRRFRVGPDIPVLIESTPPQKDRRMVVFQLDGVEEGWRFRLEGTDDRGRRTAGVDTGMWDPRLKRTRVREFILRLAPDAKTLDFRILAYRTRIVEFLAQPTPR